MTLLIFQQFTDEVVGLIAVISTIAGVVRWFVQREKSIRLAILEQREQIIILRERTKAQIEALEKRTDCIEKH